jgi:hypothetical protein
LGKVEQETSQKPTSNPDPKERRNSLFAYLGHCIRLSHEKMSSKTAMLLSRLGAD